MKRLWKYLLIILVVGVIAFIASNYFYGEFDFANSEDLFFDLGMNILYSFVIGSSNMYFFRYLEKRNWKENKPIKRILVGILGSVIITMICIFFLRMFISLYHYGITFEAFIKSQKWGYYSFGLWITLTVVVSFHFFYFFKKNQERKVKESQIVAKTESAKFESLKNQLDPHFLFNSLNVLTSLIGENPKQAEKFTTKLSKVYRYVLEQKDKDLVSLEEELSFAKSYMDLLQMRFEDGMIFQLPEQISNDELKIVPLSLQLLLENAVKHNVISSEQPLQVSIYEENGYLVIKNNSNPKQSLEKSTKVGLNNIRNRYELISKDKVEVVHENKIFIVRLPLLTQKIKKMETNYVNKNEKYARAQKRVNELKGFYIGLIAYCVIIPFLAFFNYQTTGFGNKWFLYPMLGWGLGIVIHAFMVFGYSSKWEERKIKELMNKDDN